MFQTKKYVIIYSFFLSKFYKDNDNTHKTHFSYMKTDNFEDNYRF